MTIQQQQNTAAACSPPWRMEPEISVERQGELAARRAIVPDPGQGIYPFSGMKLSRADIEWLLARHEDGRGPVDDHDESQRGRHGLDLRGADLSGEDLHGLPLAHLLGGLDTVPGEQITTAQRRAAAVRLDGANLREAHLEGAVLSNARAAGAQFQGAFLQGATLRWGDLREAHFRGADLRDADLYHAHLAGANLVAARVDGLILTKAYFDAGTNVCARFEGGKGTRGVWLADIEWGSVKLAEIDWGQVRLEDERDARRSGTVEAYQKAVRANRQIANALRAQGLNEQAFPFAYRAERLQRVVWQRQGRVSKYLFSLSLDALAGYGYKPIRSFLAYLVVIVAFAVTYHLLGPQLQWNDCLVISMTAFHGRGFFPGSFSPSDRLAFASAFEAFVGLLIEVTFIATLTQRLFGK